MNHSPNISVREISVTDIELLANYWYHSDPEHLQGMGADQTKLPERSVFIQMLTEQIQSPLKDKKSYALIWELNGTQVGHSNVNNIIYQDQATMHLHLWKPINRRNGMGTYLVKKSLPYFFNNLKLHKVICEPYALNPAPNKTLKKVGFQFMKRYTTIPGTLNFEQEVNRWELTKDKYDQLQ